MKYSYADGWNYVTKTCNTYTLKQHGKNILGFTTFIYLNTCDFKNHFLWFSFISWINLYPLKKERIKFLVFTIFSISTMIRQITLLFLWLSKKICYEKSTLPYFITKISDCFFSLILILETDLRLLKIFSNSI